MSNRCELGPVVLAAPRYRLADGRTAPAVCGCGTFAEAMTVHEASLVAVETDLADEELALPGCGVTTTPRCRPAGPTRRRCRTRSCTSTGRPSTAHN
jgi:hypothetical protein